MTTAAQDLLKQVGTSRFATVLADPPWQFCNRTGKIAPEHKRLSRYGTMTLDDIAALPVPQIVAPTAHLYLWCPNALLPDGLAVMKAWGFTYKSNLVWHKIRKDGGSDGRGVGFYFRNVTELILFGVRGKNTRTLAPGRSQAALNSNVARDITANALNARSSGAFCEYLKISMSLGFTCLFIKSSHCLLISSESPCCSMAGLTKFTNFGRALAAAFPVRAVKYFSKLIRRI